MIFMISLLYNRKRLGVISLSLAFFTKIEHIREKLIVENIQRLLDLLDPSAVPQAHGEYWCTIQSLYSLSTDGLIRSTSSLQTRLQASHGSIIYIKGTRLLGHQKIPSHLNLLQTTKISIQHYNIFVFYVSLLSLLEQLMYTNDVLNLMKGGESQRARPGLEALPQGDFPELPGTLSFSLIEPSQLGTLEPLHVSTCPLMT